MRRNPTKAEAHLWRVLRRKATGARFHRQSVLRGYIADFYCPAARLVVEADGRGHLAGKDAIRDRNLARIGLKTLRFSNVEILSKTVQVLGEIQKNVRARAAVVTGFTRPGTFFNRELTPPNSKKPRVKELLHREKVIRLRLRVDFCKDKGAIFLNRSLCENSALFLGGEAYQCDKGHWHVKRSLPVKKNLVRGAHSAAGQWSRERKIAFT